MQPFNNIEENYRYSDKIRHGWKSHTIEISPIFMIHSIVIAIFMLIKTWLILKALSVLVHADT